MKNNQFLIFSNLFLILSLSSKCSANVATKTLPYHEQQLKTSFIEPIKSNTQVTGCTINGLYGNFDKTILQAVEDIKAQHNISKKINLEKVFLSVHKTLLYGPSGTGKNHVAKMIAKETNSDFITHRASSLFERKNLISLFDKIETDLEKKPNKKIVLCIPLDELLADEVTTEYRYNLEKFLRNIFQQFDWHHQLNGQLFPIFIVRKLSTIPSQMISSFQNSLKIKIDLPNAKQRKQIIHNTLLRFGYRGFSDLEYKSLFYLLDDDIKKESHQAYQNLLKSLFWLDFKVLGYKITDANDNLADNNTRQASAKEITDCFSTVENKLKEFVEKIEITAQLKAEKNIAESNKKIAQEFKQLAAEHFKAIKTYLSRSIYQISNETLDEMAKRSEGVSGRALANKMIVYCNKFGKNFAKIFWADDLYDAIDSVKKEALQEKIPTEGELKRQNELVESLLRLTDTLRRISKQEN